MKKIAFLAAGLALAGCRTQLPRQTVPAPAAYHLLVGTYTSAGSEGIYGFTFDENTGKLTPKSSQGGIKNPSFLKFSPDYKTLYAASETATGEVVSYRFTDGKLAELSRLPSGGGAPCHLSLDASGRYVFVSNYSGGSVSSLATEPNGRLSRVVHTLMHTGSSINKERQEKPHVHSATVSPDNKMVFVADLGIDKLMGYGIDTATGKLTQQQALAVMPGSGPRHFTFHPNGRWGYLVQELTGNVTAYNYRKGRLTAFQQISTLPENFTGKNSSADIHISPDGRFLYASNRFFDTLVAFGIDPKTGRLTQLSQTPVGGKTPRNFAISPSGKYVLVANQQSNNIVVFARDVATGKLTPTGETATVSLPVCLEWGGRM